MKNHSNTYSEIQAQLRELGVKPSKDFGQNFLLDPQILQEIVDFAKPQKGAKLIEIGPGLGALTNILRHLGSLTVIDIEPEFCNFIKHKFPEVEVICEDVRQVDFSELGENLVVFGNLPYSFSTDITLHFIQFAQYIESATCLLQKEFAQRLAAAPGSKAYGTLSITAQVYAQLRLGPIVDGDAFYPPVAVESQVIRFKFRKEPLYPIEHSYWLQSVTKAAFFKRRKKIGNSMRLASILDSQKVSEALSMADISEDRRAETVSVVEYIALAEAFRILIEGSK